MKQDQPETASFENQPQHYKSVEVHNIKPYGEGKIIQSLATQKKIFQITLASLNGNADLIKNAKSIEEKMKLFNHKIFLKMLDYCEADQKQLCSKTFRVNFFYEYYPNNLASLIHSQQANQRYFSEAETIYLLFTISNLGLLLEAANSSHKDIRPCNIMLSDNYDLVKFAPIGTFPNDLNAIEKMRFLNEVTYLPPEAQDSQSDQYDWPAIDMYAAGLTMLDLMTLQFSTDIVQQKNILDKQGIIKERLLSLTKRYQVNLILIIKLMIEPDRRKRLTFKELGSFLYSSKDQILTFQTFQLKRFPKRIIEVKKEEEYPDDQLSQIIISQELTTVNSQTQAINQQYNSVQLPNQLLTKQFSQPLNVGKPIIQQLKTMPTLQTKTIPQNFLKNQVIQSQVSRFQPSIVSPKNMSLIQSVASPQNMPLIQSVASPQNIPLIQSVIQQQLPQAQEQEKNILIKHQYTLTQDSIPNIIQNNNATNSSYNIQQNTTNEVYNNAPNNTQNKNLKLASYQPKSFEDVRIQVYFDSRIKLDLVKSTE